MKRLIKFKLSACSLLTCLALGGCADTNSEKPVPPLDPSKAIEEPKPEKEEILSTPTAPGNLTRMPLGDLYQLVQRNAALVFDVRPKFFYKMGHVPNAINFPKSEFDDKISEHEEAIRAANKNNTPVVVYCTDLSCPDAMTVATKLSQRGYDVSILQGGYEAWKVAAD
ncbi:MAG: rhodanese-like domain-containing protein [Akkermansiaceae bacterium]